MVLSVIFRCQICLPLMNLSMSKRYLIYLTPKRNNRTSKEKLSSYLNFDKTPEEPQSDLSAPGPSQLPLDMDKAIKAQCASTSNVVIKDNETITSTSINRNHENDPVIDTDDDSSYAPSTSWESESDITVITTEDECYGDKDADGDEWVDIKNTTPEFEEYPHECQYNVPENVKIPNELFRLFLTDEIVDNMVLETNLYAEKFLTNPDLKKKSRFRYWKPINREEMPKFLGVALVMGLNKVPHVNHYWSKNIMYRNEYIIKVMSRDRFTAILKFWHFNDDTIDRTTDKLNKIRDVYEMLLADFKKVIVPGVPFYLEKDNPEMTIEHKYIVNTKKRRCVSCYEKARRTMNSKEADKKTKQLKGFCVKCEKTTCLLLSNEKH
ncbi:unnamed protein product [Parnassius apollo]|uniref:(apollo) hypothetical protein n=1 Tax=Parnassius apollo TaxID=110799 RepID=A0A8S3WU46_PARAO|nr:unnamed protein product [Parnassius apollo]